MLQASLDGSIPMVGSGVDGMDLLQRRAVFMRSLNIDLPTERLDIHAQVSRTHRPCVFRTDQLSPRVDQPNRACNFHDGDTEPATSGPNNNRSPGA